jgi:hypothetical protein
MSSLADLSTIMASCFTEWLEYEHAWHALNDDEMAIMTRAFGAGFLYGGLLLTREETGELP